jgi:hypothetical protein
MDKIIIKGKTFPTLVAITDEEQERGLMYAEWPPPVMSFPFNKEAKRKFWMKNTISPLDIIFCRAGKIVEICSGNPLSEKFVGPNEPTDLVIEVPAGIASKHAFQPGDQVKLCFSVSTLAKHYETKFQ